MRFTHHMWNFRGFRKLFLIILVTIILMFQRDVTPYSEVRIIVAPYTFSIESWVAKNIVSKGFYYIKKGSKQSNQDLSSKTTLISQFFEINQEIKYRNNELNRLKIDVQGVDLEHHEKDSNETGQELNLEITQLIRTRTSIQRQAEEIFESSIKSVLEDQGLVWSWFLGELVFPPVSIRFEEPPFIIISSPRDKIVMLESVILRPKLSDTQIQEIERSVLHKNELSIWIGKIGGLATYPAIIPYSPNSELVFKTSAHEWLHHYWFFRPLGSGYSSSLEMTTLNETAADIAGNELGVQAMEMLGLQSEIPPPTLLPIETDPFDFNFEMHLTRLKVEALLEEGKILEAEEYMEERRLVFVSKGYKFRKLNQAYFAFHGTYGESPSSVSPIAGQLKLLRSNSSSLGSFVKLVGGFGDYQEFMEYVVELIEYGCNKETC